jgi:hypothetical protein
MELQMRIIRMIERLRLLDKQSKSLALRPETICRSLSRAMVSAPA